MAPIAPSALHIVRSRANKRPHPQMAILQKDDPMSQRERVVKCCRSAIKVLLKEHKKSPLFNMREEDFRASLLQKLREKIKDDVYVTLKNDEDDNKLLIEQPEKALTSLVHSEVRLINKRTKGKSNEKDRQTYDIVVLKNQRVVFRVKQSGADVLEKLNFENVAVVIEIKASPSNKTCRDIQGDLTKLARLKNIDRFLVVIDKSITHGLPTIGGRKPNWSWKESERKSVVRERNLEVCFLDEKGNVVCEPFGT